MQIVSQAKDMVIPFNGARLYMKDAYNTQIIAMMPNKEGKVVAEYSTYDRAKAILDEIVKNVASEDRGVYYMPAE